MTIRAVSIGLVACALIIGSASAQQPTPPSFRFERAIVETCAGPCRLPVDVPLLAATASKDLRDLRLYDSTGREVGYMFVGNPSGVPTYMPAAVLAISPAETRTSKTSAFEADLREQTIVDRFRVEGLPPPFLKRVRLEGSGDREHWTLLVAEGTMFDLPNDRLRQTELLFTPGSYRYLRLTWDDTNSGRLPHPTEVFGGRREIATPPPALTAALTFERRPSEPGRSFFRVRLPGGHLPISALELDVAGGHLLREASVFEARLSGAELVPVALGRATLRRVIADDVTASALRIPIQPPSDSQLDLVLNDGDNPPLDLRGITAIFAEQPWIYFESPSGGLTARYGNDSLKPPRYDIEALRGEVKIDSVPKASWGEPAPRPADAASAAAPFPTAGASVDPKQFKYLRAVSPGSAGLIAVAFDASVLAHSAGVNAGFADVRVIDDSGHQIPYVLERASEPLSLEVVLERQATRPPVMAASPAIGQSVYRVKLPNDNLPAMRLVLETAARVFDRRVTVAVERPADNRRRDPWLDRIALTRWLHSDPERTVSPVTIAIPPAHTSELLLIIDEGDNAPLPIGSAHLLLPSYRARLFREANVPLRLAYGRNDLARPQYDLALLTPRVLERPAEDVVASAEAPLATASRDSSFVSPRIFWVVLGASALVLVLMIARLLKRV